MKDTKSNTLLLLNGVAHRLSAVLANAKLAPIVAIDVKDIHALPHCGGPAESLVKFVPEQDEPGVEQEVVFFKQLGGYSVLLGRPKMEAALTAPVTEAQAKKKAASPSMVRGRLLSSPALKKCRLDNEPVEAPLDPIRTLDRGARTYQRDDSYRGNRMNFDADIRAPRRPIDSGR